MPPRVLDHGGEMYCREDTNFSRNQMWRGPIKKLIEFNYRQGPLEVGVIFTGLNKFLNSQSLRTNRINRRIDVATGDGDSSV